jgi:hypothetical protein
MLRQISSSILSQAWRKWQNCCTINTCLHLFTFYTLACRRHSLTTMSSVSSPGDIESPVVPSRAVLLKQASVHEAPATTPEGELCAHLSPEHEGRIYIIHGEVWEFQILEVTLSKLFRAPLKWSFVSLGEGWPNISLYWVKSAPYYVWYLVPGMDPGSGKRVGHPRYLTLVNFKDFLCPSADRMKP